MILFVLWEESWGADAGSGHIGGDQRGDGNEAAPCSVPVIAAALSFRAGALFLEGGSNKEQSPWKPQSKNHICVGAQEEGKQGGEGDRQPLSEIKEQAWTCLCWSEGGVRVVGTRGLTSGGQMRMLEPGARSTPSEADALWPLWEPEAWQLHVLPVKTERHRLLFHQHELGKCGYTDNRGDRTHIPLLKWGK